MAKGAKMHTPKKKIKQEFNFSTRCLKNILKQYSEFSIGLILHNIKCILNSIVSMLCSLNCEFLSIIFIRTYIEYLIISR